MTQSQPQAPVSAAFIAVIAAYFTAHTVLRTLLGGSFEVDEAEMFVMARDFRLGYGPQLPLYNWLQAAAFSLFGANTFAIAATKNLLLFATYLFFYLGLVRLVPGRGLAIATTLVLLLLPNVSWQAQRAGSHTIAMLAAMGAVFWLTVMVWQVRRSRDYLLLGVALGLGGLAKYNFWLFVLGLGGSALWHPGLRAALWDRRMLGTAAIAAAMVAGPYLWITGNLDKGLSSTGKLYDGADAGWLSGMRDLTLESLAALALMALVLLAARFGARDGFWRWGRPPEASRWLLRAGGIAFVAMVLGVIVADISLVRSRWLLPAYIPFALGLAFWALAGVSARALRNTLRFCALLALLLLGGMAELRLRGSGSAAMNLSELADALDRDFDEATVLVSDFYLGGNLVHHRPAWTIVPPVEGAQVPASARRVVVVHPWKGNKHRDYPAIDALDRPVLSRREDVLQISQRFKGNKRVAIRYEVLELGAATE